MRGRMLAALAALWLGGWAVAHPPTPPCHDAYKGPVGALSCEVRYGFYPTVWQPWCVLHPPATPMAVTPVVPVPTPVVPPEPLNQPPKVVPTPTSLSTSSYSPYRLAAPRPVSRP